MERKKWASPAIRNSLGTPAQAVEPVPAGDSDWHPAGIQLGMEHPIRWVHTPMISVSTKAPVPQLHVEPAELSGRMIRDPFFECSWLEKTLTLLCYPREEKGAAQNKTVDFSYQMGD